MTLQTIDIPLEIKLLSHSPAAARLIDMAYDNIEAFMLNESSLDNSTNDDDPGVLNSENFIPCDFHLLDQSLTWMEQNPLLNSQRFCELGSGFGVAASLASIRGMDSIGIEIDSSLVEQANILAKALDLPARFYSGNFVPKDFGKFKPASSEKVGSSFAEYVETSESDIYEEIGIGFSEFDLFFAFPWPGEHDFFESVFEAGASVGSLLLTYRGSNGMHLIRKTG